jgi:phospholipase B1
MSSVVIVRLVVFLLVCVSCLVVRDAHAELLSSADSRELEFFEKILSMSEQIERHPALKADWRLRVQADKALELPAVNFTCNVTGYRSATRPTSVHKLMPGDIDVVAAFGDSISAGNGLGAEVLPQVAKENRAEVWSIGGQLSLDQGVVTLPNIIRKFNPELKGFSLCFSQETSATKSWFNVAKPGGTCDDMYNEAVMLVTRMKDDPRIDFANDWKLLTMFVGGNDLCASCRRNYSAEMYEYEFDRTLKYLHDNLNRTVVNLVSMFDITPLQNFSTGIACDLLQWGFCDCARNLSSLPTMRPIQLGYDQVYAKLAADPKFKRDDFTVIHQPHLRDMVPPTDPETGGFLQGFLSPDCFHPNRIAHQAFALYYWNDLLIPVGQKPTTTDANNVNIPISCPTPERPYIFTDGNSGLTTVSGVSTTTTTTTTTSASTTTPTTTTTTTTTTSATTSATTTTPTPTSSPTTP